jgi:phosphate transport system protein
MSDAILHPQPHRGAVGDELKRIREVVLVMGDHVDEAITKATAGLCDRDVESCAEVIAGDVKVNGLQAEARDLSYIAILNRASVPRDVREIMGFLHMAAELERMGDHCVNIAHIARDLADVPPLKSPVDIPRLSSVCAEQVRDILSALVALDVDEARVIAARDDRVNRIYHRLIDDILQLMVEDGGNAYRGTHLIMAAQNFERIGDRVTNLAEDLVFLESGGIEDLG